MRKTVLIPALLLLIAACGGPELKDFHLVLIGEMEPFEELDLWTPVAEGAAGPETAAAEKLLRKDYADLMDLVRTKSVVALSREAGDAMDGYTAVSKISDVELTPVAESEDKSMLLLAGVWEELPKKDPTVERRLMVYPVYDRGQKKLDHITVTIRRP